MGNNVSFPNSDVRRAGKEGIHILQDNMRNEVSLPYTICKLNKALYVLKQASWAWFQKFIIVNTCFGFFYSDIDSTVFG